MKRGKDGEKIMGPLFPRLHVNDKEKGGPRAPPRNKMALYEQLSIPTQRYNSGVMLQNPSCTSSSVHPPSSSQGHSLERNLHVAHSVSPSTSSQRSEKFNSRQPARAALTTPLSQPEQRKMVGDEDDFAVPVYFRPGLDDSSGKTENGIDKGRLSPSRRTYSGHSIRLQNNTSQDPQRSSSSRSVSPENLSARDASAEPVKESSAYPIQECEDLPTLSFRRSNNSITCSHEESRARTQQNGCIDGDDSMREVEKEADPQPGGGSHSREGYGCPNEPSNHPNHGDNTCGSMQLGNGDKSDDFSETSMVDSMSDMDITPDDMVGIIGQKHFWKARRAIANQQRVFAVQVFELHRLIKVQKLIAASPQLIHDESAFLGKPSIKASPAKNLPSQYVVKPLPHVLKRKGSLENPAHKMEFSAENAVGKTPSSVKNGSHPLNYGPYHANPPPPTLPMPTDSRMNPWCYHQSPGHHQWLVPVMSASEGLIYKPYPGPGFMGSVCGGGCGPYGMMPVSGNLMNPAYGVPPPAHQQGIGVPPASHPVGHGFFPPYGMPILSPSIQNSAQEQKNQFVAPSSNGSEAHNNTNPHETSCYVPSQKSGANPRVVGFQASRETELLGSTASSPSERVLANGTTTAAEGREAVSPFPATAAAVVPEEAAQPHETEQLTRVIRVVPHNPRSATESAARIFQSIQEERKHYDSV